MQIEERTEPVVLGPMTPGEAKIAKEAEDKKQRIKLITDLAEDIHPDLWDFGPCERGLMNLVSQYVRGYTPSKCNDCANCSNNDICENIDWSGGYNRLLIKFPEAELTNENEDTLSLEDVYIAIIFNNDCTKTATSKLFLIRGTASTVEYSRGYMHSHAYTIGYNPSVTQYFVWRELCLGGDTELTDVTYSLSQGIEEKPLHELLVLLHVYVEWESEDGGPYMYMTDVTYPLGNRESQQSEVNYFEIIRSMLAIIDDDVDIELPEIMGSAISNVSTSIEPLIKRVLVESILKEAQEESKQFSQTRLISKLGHVRDSGFVSISNTRSNTEQGIDFYRNAVEQASTMNTDGNTVKFRDEDCTFKLNLDETGLTSFDEITEEAMANSRVEPYLVRSISTRYINKLNSFKETITHVKK